MTIKKLISTEKTETHDILKVIDSEFIKLVEAKNLVKIDSVYIDIEFMNVIYNTCDGGHLLDYGWFTI